VSSGVSRLPSQGGYPGNSHSGQQCPFEGCRILVAHSLTLHNPPPAWMAELSEHARLLKLQPAQTRQPPQTQSLQPEFFDWSPYADDYGWHFMDDEEDFSEEEQTKGKALRRNPPKEGWNCEEEEEEIVTMPKHPTTVSTNALEQAFLLALQQPVQSNKKRKKGKKGKEEED